MTALSEIEKDLKATFPAHDYEQWKSAADALLKGKPFEKLLVTPTYEGFDLQPIFRKDDLEALQFSKDLPGAGSFVRGSRPAGGFRNRWKISQELPYADAKTLNDAIKREIAGGADEINIMLDIASQNGTDPTEAAVGEVGGCGLSLATVGDLEVALKGVDLANTSVFIHSGNAGGAVLALLRACARKQGVSCKSLKGNMGMDPIGLLMRSGKLGADIESTIKKTAEVAEALGKCECGLTAYYVDGNVFHNAGSSAVQELGFTLASANEYLKAQTEAGLSAAEAAGNMRFGFGIGSNYFLEVAKLRAARMLWARILEAWGASSDELPIHIHARTSTWNKTAVDPYSNMLRVTSEAFSAVIGGCDSMHVGPFDEVVRLPDEFSSRISRNIHTILAEECELTRVIDPAGGSYYIEWLTDQVAQKAWEWFQKVESEGGLVAALKNGSVQSAINAVYEKRIANIKKRRDVIVGSNQYPNVSEKAIDARPLDYAAMKSDRSAVVSAIKRTVEVADDKVGAAMDGATIGELSASIMGELGEGTSIEPILSRRGAEPYEQLRTAASEYEAKHGHAPKLFQANWGPSRGYRLRADWTSAFYQVAGFDVMNDRDFDSIDEMVEALKQSGSKVAVVTSSDAAYAESLVDIAQAIKTADSSVYVIAAGAPGESESEWRAAGVDDFVNVRVNNHGMLSMLFEKVGVTA
jgi:methylmalonyl-CoA mutase